MSINIYRLTSKDMAGFIYLIYENGILRQVMNELREPITAWEETIAAIPQMERHANDCLIAKLPHCQITLMPTKTVREKLIAFVSHYKHFRHVSYQASKNETANLKNVPVTDALLTAFFTSGAWFVQNNYTISNYISRINLIKDFVKNGAAVKSKYPNDWDEAFENKCTPADLAEYWAHLRALGFKKVTGRKSWTKEVPHA